MAVTLNMTDDTITCSLCSFGREVRIPRLALLFFDVTDLPEAPREVGRIRQSETPGGFHNIFTYKHSGGSPLLFATSGPSAKVFDLGSLY